MFNRPDSVNMAVIRLVLRNAAMPRFSLRVFLVFALLASIGMCFALEYMFKKPDPNWNATIGGPIGFPLTLEMAEITLNHSIPFYAAQINAPIEIIEMEPVATGPKTRIFRHGQEYECTMYRCQTRSVSGNKSGHIMLIEHQSPMWD